MKRHEFDNSDAWHSRGYMPHYDVADKLQMITYRLGDCLPHAVLVELGSPHSDEALEILSPKEAMKRRKLIEEALDMGFGSCVLAQAKVAEKQIEAWKHFDGERYDLIAYVVMPNHVHVLIRTYEGWPLSKLIWSWKRHVSHFLQKDCEDLWKCYEKSFREFKGKLDELRKGFESSTSPHRNEVSPGEGIESSTPPHRNEASPAKDIESSTQVHRNEMLPGEGKFPVWQREYWDRFIRDENHFYKAIHYIHENPVKAGLVARAQDYLWSSAKSMKGRI